MSHDRDLFAGTAYYYARYRAPYPAELFDFLTGEFALDESGAALDLGCGTGQLALPLSHRVGAVWAIDPDPDMIAAGVHAEASSARTGRIRWILGRGEDLPTFGLTGLRLCTMGASFHWMDRELVLKSLDEVVGADGGVALVSGSASIFSKSDSAQGAWLDVARQVVMEFLGPQRRAGRGTYSHPKRSHEEVLAGSPFREVTVRRFTSTRNLTVDDVTGQQLSTSYASPALLGDRIGDFREEMARQLTALGPPGGVFPTVEHTDVILARR